MNISNQGTRVPRVTLTQKIFRYRYRYLLLLPSFIVVFLFSYLPLTGLYMAFSEVRFNQSIFQGAWNDFAHFKQFLNNYNSIDLIKNTIFIAFLKIVVYFPFPILLALMFNELNQGPYKRLSQTISYLPNFLSWVIVISILDRIFAPNTGLINQVISALGGDGSHFWRMDSSFFYPSVFATYLWKSIGWDSIIYLAAITNVNTELYEAASIDGATRLKQIQHIILPSISYIIGLNFILGLGGILSAGFEQIYLLKTPGNMHIADILDTYIIQQGLERGQYGYTTAVGLIQSVVGVILVLSVNQLSKRLSDVNII